MQSPAAPLEHLLVESLLGARLPMHAERHREPDAMSDNAIDLLHVPTRREEVLRLQQQQLDVLDGGEVGLVLAFPEGVLRPSVVLRGLLGVLGAGDVEARDGAGHHEVGRVDAEVDLDLQRFGGREAELLDDFDLVPVHELGQGLHVEQLRVLDAQVHSGHDLRAEGGELSVVRGRGHGEIEGEGGRARARTGDR